MVAAMATATVIITAIGHIIIIAIAMLGLFTPETNNIGTEAVMVGNMIDHIHIIMIETGTVAVGQVEEGVGIDIIDIYYRKRGSIEPLFILKTLEKL